MMPKSELPAKDLFPFFAESMSQIVGRGGLDADAARKAAKTEKTNNHDSGSNSDLPPKGMPNSAPPYPSYDPSLVPLMLCVCLCLSVWHYMPLDMTVVPVIAPPSHPYLSHQLPASR